MAAKLFHPRGAKLFAETPGGGTRFGVIRDVEAPGGEVVDECLAAVFRAPHSYTGEDSVEFYLHGSQYIVSSVCKLLSKFGTRMAEPGEFSRRAFVNGQMDLSQAEAVADLIEAESAAAHDVAMSQMRGGYSKELAAMRAGLLEIAALLELELDFAEEDVEFADRSKLRSLVENVLGKVDSMIESFALGNVIKNGVPVAIIGPTNVGKSTLLNALLGENRAIVSDIAGTTRDTIEERLVLAGISFRFIDTAGIRHSTDEIECIGIERSLQALARAKVVLLMLPAPELAACGVAHCGGSDSTLHHDCVSDDCTEETVKGSACESAAGDAVADGTLFGGLLPHSVLELLYGRSLIVLLSKSDLCDSDALLGAEAAVRNSLAAKGLETACILTISAKTGVGTDELKNVLISSQNALQDHGYACLVSNQRHWEVLRSASAALTRVLEGLSTTLPPDLLAQDLRAALAHLGSITGEITTDEVLGEVFGRFCIGK